MIQSIQNNGKVFLYKFGKKIFDKIMAKARPTFEDEDPVNVFDYWEGANFKLRMKVVDKYPNYDSSEFESVSAVADDDQEILDVAKQQYDLNEFLDPKNFKTYDELKAKLDAVLSGTSMAETAYQAATAEDEEVETIAAKPARPSKPAPQPRKAVAAGLDEDDDEDMMSYFKSIAEE